jgi:hypothetical protein
MNGSPLLRLSLTAFIALAALGGCETTPPKATYPALTYGHHGVIGLDVRKIQIVSKYAAPLKAPNVEHLAPVGLADTMERWARDRLKARGGTGRARVTIIKASIIEVPLKVRGGFRGAITTDQSERYDAGAEMIIEILDERGIQKAFVKGAAERTRTVAEGVPPAQRDRVWFELVEALMNDLNGSLDRNIRVYFARYIR